ncbi:MAG TPA: zinc-dependent alcohol dehydrogenase [Blastocatellia bacterium]|nr:zinc-dependent alcohol dehydrogenase [Blastocatellia bacterium]
MKAAVLHEFKQPLEIEQVPTPEPGAGQVLIKVEAAGVCHSDLHLAQGDWTQLSAILKRPLILGHEVVGRVVKRGPGVQDLKEGDRAGVAWLHWSCDECDICREGNENLCPAQVITGATVNGGYAEYILARASHAIKVPTTLKSEEAAPLFCAGVTTYRAVKRAGVKPGDRVAIFGIGGLGHLALQIAQTFGATIIAVDVAEEKLEFARSLGAEETLNARTVDVVKEMRRMGRVQAAIVTSAAKSAYDSAFASVRQGGALIVVGLPAEPLCFQAIMMAATEIRIIASSVGTREDLREVLDLAAAGKVRCHVESRPLEQINQVLDEMRNGKLSGRVVVTP